jgi:adenylate cyclase class IV
MADLFSNQDKPTTEQPVEEVKTKVYYKGAKGRFTDKDSAWRTEMINDRNRYKVNFEHYKRLAHRLSEEYHAEHEKVLRLEAEIKRLTTPIHNLYEQTNLQQEKILAS